jgi:glutathione S-transferase
MAEYQLYCFAQSGNAYRAALMLNLIGADWEPVFVDFFGKGETRSAEYRTNVNEMGEVPVLVHGARKLSQSGVILNYLAELSGKFLPRGDDARLEAWRWIIFDNQKVNGFLGPYRFLRNYAKPPPHPAVLEFVKGRLDNALGIVDRRLDSRSYVLGSEPTIADLSLVAYLYYPTEELGFNVSAQHKNIGAWLDRIRALPRWAKPYDLMPGHCAASSGKCRYTVERRTPACAARALIEVRAGPIVPCNSTALSVMRTRVCSSCSARRVIR